MGIFKKIQNIFFLFLLVFPVLLSGGNHDQKYNENEKVIYEEVVSGVIKKINYESKILIIDHERIKSIKMKAMVMPFKVARNNLLENLSEGQKIKFKFYVLDNKIIIFEIVPN